MTTTKQALVDMGIYPNLKGYKLIPRAAEIFRQHPDIPRIKRDIYEVIAQETNTKWQAVERDIRHAINIAKSKNCLGNCPWGDDGLEYVTNSNFIALMAEYTEG